MKTIVISYKTKEGIIALPVSIKCDNDASDFNIASVNNDRYEAVKLAAQSIPVKEMVNPQWFNEYVNGGNGKALKPNIIHCQTGKVYRNLVEAASATEISYSALSNHLNHPQIFTSCKGQTFFRS